MSTRRCGRKPPDDAVLPPVDTWLEKAASRHLACSDLGAHRMVEARRSCSYSRVSQPAGTSRVCLVPVVTRRWPCQMCVFRGRIAVSAFATGGRGLTDQVS